MPPKPLPADALIAGANVNTKDSRRDSLLKKVTSETGFGVGQGKYCIYKNLLWSLMNYSTKVVLFQHIVDNMHVSCAILYYFADGTSEGSDYSEDNETQEEEDNSRPRAADLKLPKLVFTDEVEGAGFKSAVRSVTIDSFTFLTLLLVLICLTLW